jgi:hypothetical protein
MFNSSIFMAGKFEFAGSPLVVDITVTSGGPLIASWACLDEAKRIADSYTQGNTVTKVTAITEQIVQPGKTVRLSAAHTDCPLVLITRPAEEAALPVTFKYMIYRQGEKQEPLVKCN